MPIQTNWIEKGQAAFAQLGQIADGYTNLFRSGLDLLSPRERELYEARYAICQVCPLRINNTCTSLRSIKHVVTGQYVSGCGCGLDAATKAPTKECPAGKWGPVDHLLSNQE